MPIALICIKIESLTLTVFKKLRSMKFLRVYLSLACMSLCTSLLLAQGYRIEVDIAGLSRDTVILGEYFTSRMIPVDTVVLDQKGRGTFEGDQAFTGGL